MSVAAAEPGSSSLPAAARGETNKLVPGVCLTRSRLSDRCPLLRLFCCSALGIDLRPQCVEACRALVAGAESSFCDGANVHFTVGDMCEADEVVRRWREQMQMPEVRFGGMFTSV